MSLEGRRADEPGRISAAVAATRPPAPIRVIPPRSPGARAKAPGPVTEGASTAPPPRPPSSTIHTVGTATVEVKVNRTERRAGRGRPWPAELNTPMVVTPREKPSLYAEAGTTVSVTILGHPGLTGPVLRRIAGLLFRLTQGFRPGSAGGVLGCSRRGTSWVTLPPAAPGTA